MKRIGEKILDWLVFYIIIPLWQLSGIIIVVELFILMKLGIVERERIIKGIFINDMEHNEDITGI